MRQLHPTIQKKSHLSAAKFAGDSIYDVLGHGYNVTGEYDDAGGFRVFDIDGFKAEQGSRLTSENINSQEYVEDY